MARRTYTEIVDDITGERNMKPLKSVSKMTRFIYYVNFIYCDIIFISLSVQEPITCFGSIGSAFIQGDTGVGVGDLNTAIPQKDSANTAISQKTTPKTATLQYQDETRSHTDSTTLDLYVNFTVLITRK